MATFEQGDVVRVPFPYTDRNTRHHRPALVISTGGVESAHGLLWVLMITSAENRGWPGDVSINNLVSAGLPAPSVVRTAKIATIESRDAVRLGRLSSTSLKEVTGRVARELGLRLP
jgi:mRNA interferase MazF